MIVVEIRDIGRPPGANERKGMNRFVYKKLREGWEMRLIVERLPEIPTPCHLVFTVFSANAMDWDNVCSCAKVPLDALQRIDKLAQDNPKHILSFTPRQERCTRKTAGVRLEFTPEEDA